MSVEAETTKPPYKMRDLCALTGLPRQVVHFYIQQGLVPEGVKTGRNTALYGDEHVQRIRLVRQLQHERFLPLKAIRAMLEARDEVFSPAQRRLLEEVKGRLSTAVVPAREARETVAVEAVAEAAKVTRADVDALAKVGLLAVVDDGGRDVVARDDVWIVELWGELRAAGFTEALGFTPADLGLYERAVGALFHDEMKLVADRTAGLAPADLAAMLERALPLINLFLTRYHLSRVRTFLSTL